MTTPSAEKDAPRQRYWWTITCSGSHVTGWSGPGVPYGTPPPETTEDRA